jgi:hypothetical protein
MQPIVGGLEQDYGDQMDFISLNAADGGTGEAALQYYQLRGHPSIVIVRSDGTVVWSQTGVSSRDDIEQAIWQILKP